MAGRPDRRLDKHVHGHVDESTESQLGEKGSSRRFPAEQKLERALASILNQVDGGSKVDQEPDQVAGEMDSLSVSGALDGPAADPANLDEGGH